MASFSLDHLKYQFQSFNLCLLFYLIYLLFVFKRIVEISFKLASFRYHQTQSVYLTVLFFQSLAVQFSRTIPIKGFFRFPLLPLTRDLYIISYLEAFVKRFGKSLLSFFRTLLLFRFGLLRPFGRFWLTLILYHIFRRLSRSFAKVFSDFLNLPLGVSASLTAYIV